MRDRLLGGNRPGARGPLLLNKKRLGLVLLALAPVIDLLLLVATVTHLRSGAEAEWAHGLAALYIGFSIACGKRMIR